MARWWRSDMRVNPGESYLDILPPEYFEPDHDDLVQQLQDEFDAIDDCGFGRDARSPGEALLDSCGDDLVDAAFLATQGKPEEASAAFLAAVAKARDKYVSLNLDAMIREREEARYARRRGSYRDDSED